MKFTIFSFMTLSLFVVQIAASDDIKKMQERRRQNNETIVLGGFMSDNNTGQTPILSHIQPIGDDRNSGRSQSRGYFQSRTASADRARAALFAGRPSTENDDWYGAFSATGNYTSTSYVPYADYSDRPLNSNTIFWRDRRMFTNHQLSWQYYANLVRDDAADEPFFRNLSNFHIDCALNRMTEEDRQNNPQEVERLMNIKRQIEAREGQN